MAEYHNLNYSHPSIPEMGIKEKKYPFNKKLKTIKFKAGSNLEAKKYDRHHLKWFSSEYSNCNFDFYSFLFYFEDYTIYKPHMNKITSWFSSVKKKNTKDLVLHFRMKNRLVWETHYKNFIKPKRYKQIIKDNFNFERLYIVGDMEKWKYISKNDVIKVQREISIKYRKNPTKFISADKSVEYMNEIIDNFKEFDPKLHHSKRFIDDFSFIRSFDKIMFKNSTFAWWAAFLSQASQVGVFGPWKPNKGKNKNRNLGRTDFPGWFSWGKIDDLLNPLLIE